MTRLPMCWAVNPTSSSSWARLACWRNRCGIPNRADLRATTRFAQCARHCRPDPADHAVVLDGDHEPMRTREVDDLIGHRLHPPRVDHGRADLLCCQPLGHVHPDTGHRPYGDQQNIGGSLLSENVHRALSPDRGDVVWDSALWGISPQSVRR